MDGIRYGKRLQGRLVWLSRDRGRRTEVELPDGATLESEVMLADDGAFREHGTIRLATGSELHFRTLGAGSIVGSPIPAAPSPPSPPSPDNPAASCRPSP